MSKQMDLDITASAEILRKAIGARAPRIAIVLGSGLGGLAAHAQDTVSIPYADLPGFPRPGVVGHAGMLIAGTVGGVPAVFLKGRVHFYEGSDPTPLKVMIRTMRTIGIDTLFLSNAAGSLHPDFPAGNIMAISDHLNLSGINPLAGDNDDAWGERFVSMYEAWDSDLRAMLVAAARAQDIPIREGVYAWFRGPSFETPAEIRMARTCGADSVGMSTVPDCLIARHCGMKVVGCSAITNLGAGLGDHGHTHEGTLKGAAMAADKMERTVIRFLRDWQDWREARAA